MHRSAYGGKAEITIVTHEPHGLSQGPLGSCVGGEPPVVHGKGCRVCLILQILVELAQRR